MSTISQPKVASTGLTPRLVFPPPPSPARPTRTWFRLSWLAGIGILILSVAGASRILNTNASSSKNDSKVPAERGFSGSPGVVCLGTIDSEHAPGGYVALAPTQPGEIVEMLVYEGQQVKKGDVLLRVDDEAPMQLVVLAEVAMKVAEAQAQQAQQLTEVYRGSVEAQQGAVEAARHKIGAAEFRLKRARHLKDSVGQSNDDEINSAVEEVSALKGALAGEEAKLRSIQANRPESKIREADENLALARQRVQQARTAWKKCTLEAPSDGTILRINAAKGAILGPQTRHAPILFAPSGPRIVRAEVEQEFAHRMQVGMPASIQDESNAQVIWAGKVKRLGAAFLPKRSANGVESFSLSGETNRVLECIIELDPGQTPPMLGQKVRVSIGTHG